MPFLLLDDAADEASRRLQQFGDDQLSGLSQGAQDLGASAQDATQRLMQFGQGQLQSLQQQAMQAQQQQQSDLDAITGRLHAFGQQSLQDAQNALQPLQQPVQQAVQQLTPLQPLTPPANQGGQVQQGQTLQFPGGDTSGAIDASSPSAFARTIAPYAQYAAQALGIDPTWVAAMAGSESNYGKAPGNELFGIKAPGTAGSQTLATHEGEYGGTAQNASFGAYNTPLEATQAFVDLIKNHYPGAIGAQTLDQFVHGLKQGGYFTAAEPEYKGILQSIANNIGGDVQQGLSGAGAAAGGAVQAVRSAPGVAQAALGQLSQFGQQGLSDAEAYAACGPAAAVRFAEMFGRNPTLAEATELAKQVGWNAAQGMAGLSSEGSLFDKMDIPHRTVGADWNALAQEASSGNPVVISTPGHYFTADAYDPSTGAFHVGQSGKDLRLGSEWMTPSQMEGVMGKLQGGLAVDNPGVSAPSPLSSPPTSSASSGNGNPIDQAKQLAQQGISALDQNGLLRDVGQNIVKPLLGMPNTSTAGIGSVDLGQGIQPATAAVAGSLDSLANQNERLGLDPSLTPNSLLRAGASFLRSPGVLDSMKTLQDLSTKYGTMDSSTYNPQDQQAANQALIAVGGVVGGAGDSTRMYHGTGADFPTVDPQRLGGEDNLFGPGYYLTDRPEVAGGVVTQGGEQVGPSWLQSSVKRPAGAVVSPGYAQQRAVQEGLAPEQLADLQRRVDTAHATLANNPSPDLRQYVEQDLADAQAKLDSNMRGAGANVRAVDVPQGLNLLDVDAPVQQDTIDAISRVLTPEQRAAFEDSLDSAQVFASSGRSLTGNAVSLRGSDVWTALGDALAPAAGDEGFTAFGAGGGDAKAAANEVLARAGFDGITYQGGNRIPMMDANGMPIQHQANVIFPDSLNKITNAISGTQGGQIDPRFALGLAGGTAALGALGLGITDPNSDRLGLRDALLRTPGPDTDGTWQSPVTLEDVTQNPILQDVASNIIAPLLGRPNAPLTSTFGGGGVLDSLQTLQDLNAKYADTPGAQTIPVKGQAPMTLSVDPSQMTPDDAAKYQQAQAMVGGLTIPNIDQSTLQGIRSLGLVAGPTTPAARGAIGTAVDVTKQMMLSNPATHVANIIGNTLELLRSPAALTLGGRPLDAIAGSGAVMKGIPEAASAAVQALRGTAPATLGGPAQTSRWWEPVYKALGAADQFTRTLGEYQGMAEQASAMLRQAGISPNDPAASSFLTAHANDLLDAGRRAGSNSVFAMQRTPTGGLGFLDNLFHNYSQWKEGLLNSPSLRDQALGALADTQIPFAGVPSRILQIGLGRLPGVGTATAGARAVAAARAGNMPEMQRQIGNALLEGMFTALIVKNIADGNIRGPDDPDHPGEVKVLGNWINGGALGAYALPALISAAAVDGFQKPLTTPPDTTQDALMARAGNALTASFKPFVQAIPGMQMVHFLSSLGEGPGKALQGELQDTINRITAPGAAKFIEDLTDPTQRDVSQGLAGLWESPMSKWPVLANLLPAKVDPTTGEPMEKRRSGLGTLVGAESYDESPIREEANRLNKLGYDTAPPSSYPDTVTVGNAVVKLSPDEQRAVTAITGQRLGSFTDALTSSAYQNADDDTKARMMRAYLAAADRARLSAAVQVIGYPELVDRASRGQRVVGRLSNQGPTIEVPSLEDMLKGAAAA